MTTLASSAAWNRLEELAQRVSQQNMKDMFANDESRAEKYSREAAGLFLDFSKNQINEEVLDALNNLAQQCNVKQKMQDMFAGLPINSTEGRSVLHTALRNFSDRPVYVEGENVMPQVRATLDKIKVFTNEVLNNTRTGHTGKPFDTVVSIGIGGSFLGPKIVTEALKPYRVKGLNVKFVANVDGCHIHDVLSEIDLETTLFVMSSKSFGTQETLQNTLTAKQWFLENGGTQSAIAKHFVAVSSNVTAAVEFGMDEDNIFPMADWVGGRYSLWSAIGLPISLALGYDHFYSLLEGAYEMDEHVMNTPAEDNLAYILALLGVWYRNFMGSQSHCILPYYHYLRGLPAYVQQLDMESNGKSTNQQGDRVDYATGPIIWGSEGTNGQHSFHQLIHQSKTPIPVDFILPLNVENQDGTHHNMLASNCFGQSQALMQGKTYEECLADLQSSDLNEAEKQALANHKTMDGNKPSNTILIDKLTPKRLGALIALYEHKVFVQGAIWDVNSFDQWGVELGKVLGNQVLTQIERGSADSDIDSSTQMLINRFTSKNK